MSEMSAIPLANKQREEIDDTVIRVRFENVIVSIKQASCQLSLFHAKVHLLISKVRIGGGLVINEVGRKANTLTRNDYKVLTPPMSIVNSVPIMSS